MSDLHLTLHSIREDRPGSKWQQRFELFWPLYKSWFLSEGHRARPGYVTSRKQLARHMPELLPTYESLVDLAGGGDLVARFLSLYCPPPYLSGCSQAVWSQRDGPLLVRNYDYSPRLFEGHLLYTHWQQPVIAMSDCLWGVLDGFNAAGLAVSLTFGGRRLVGDGFGIPLVLRYILQTCQHTAEAQAVLQRIPTHMPYNVTVVDRQGDFITAYLGPGQDALVTREPVGTNHQQEIEWPDYARLTSTVERQEFLKKKLLDSRETAGKFIRHFLHPPLHNTRYEKAFGTLYTAVYHLDRLEAELHWPNQSSLRQSFSVFKEGRTTVNLKLARSAFKRSTVS